MYKKYEAFREKAGLTDYAVAKASGLSPVVFSEWKSGKSNPKADKLLKIAKVLNVTIEDLLEEVTV